MPSGKPRSGADPPHRQTEISAAWQARNVSVYLVSPSCPFPPPPPTRSPPAVRCTVRATGHLTLNSLTLDLAPKQFPSSLWGNLILPPPHPQNAKPPPRETPGLCSQGPLSPQPTAYCVKKHKFSASHIHVLEPGFVRAPHPILRYTLYILEAESDFWTREHFLNGDSAYFLSNIFNSQLA